LLLAPRELAADASTQLAADERAELPIVDLRNAEKR
jgi:hypothetical protein